MTTPTGAPRCAAHAALSLEAVTPSFSAPGSARRSALACLLALLVGVTGSRARAQSLGTPPGYAEYLALLGTPAASLPPLPTYTIIGIVQRSPEIAARYGYIPDITRPLAPATGGHASHSLDSFGLTGILPVGLGGTASVTAGISNERCPGCSGSRFMASAAGDYRLLRTAIGSGTDAMRLTMALDGEAGFGRFMGRTTWTADLGVPLALAVGPPASTQIIPFITPSIAVLSTNSATAGASDLRAGRALLGGGVALFNPKSILAASVGFQYVFVAKTQMQIGVGLSVGGR